MPALGLPNLQGVYDSSLGSSPLVELDASVGGFSIEDNAAPIGGDLFSVAANGGGNYWAVQAAALVGSPSNLEDWRLTSTTWALGRSTRRLFLASWPDTTGRMGVEVFPDDFTISTATGTSNTVFFTVAGRTITLSIPGGAPFGNDTAPGFANFAHTVRFADPGFAFASQLLVNAAVQIEAAAAVGPIYLFLDQYRTYADGGAFVCSQHNAMRAQPTWGPNINGGSITQTSAELYFAAASVDGTVGTATVTTLRYFAANAPTLTAGGTIGTLEVLNIPDIPAAGITTLRGIASAMSSGEFIRHTGTAPVQLGGSLQLGSGATFDWILSRLAANIATLADGDSLRITTGSMFFGPSGGVSIQSTVNTEATVTSTRLGFGVTPAGANWAFAFSATARAIALAGDFANCLNTAGGNHTINAALSTFTQWTINAPTGTLGTGSVVTAANVIIQTAVAVGTNRYGLLVSSNPAGGTLNYCARFSGAAGVRVDGLFEQSGSVATLFGIRGVTPIAAPSAYTVTNHTADKTYDANATTVNELADVVGSLILDFINQGLLQGSVT